MHAELTLKIAGAAILKKLTVQKPEAQKKCRQRFNGIESDADL